MTDILYTNNYGQTIQHEALAVGAAVPTIIVYGQTTVVGAGTAVVLGSATALTSGVTVKANSDNTGVIYLGGSAVSSSTGFILAAGEERFVEIDDVAKVFIDAGTNDDGVSWIGG